MYAATASLADVVTLPAASALSDALVPDTAAASASSERPSRPSRPSRKRAEHHDSGADGAFLTAFRGAERRDGDLGVAGCGT